MEEKNSLISKNLEERIERHFIGVSPQIIEVLDQAMTAANFPDVNVLITGESGTGKENIARIIHFASKRKDNIFCAVNSSAVTDSLLESEFFGHKKGSFTGALTDKKGFFETSDQGTLFLDEIADMPLNLQAKMLRAIEEKKITRVGETHQIATDFRIISATNHELEKLVEEKRFRLDLIHRLNTLHIHIPPLRERPEDIEPLLLYFAEDFSTKMNKLIPPIDKEVIQTLKSYAFPGNVRELKNMTERAIILSKGNNIGIHDFPVNAKSKSAQAAEAPKLNLEENEAELIRTALQTCNNNQIATANALGIQRMALTRKMQKYNINIAKLEK
jgi:transcriptional regulator with PAS, ATPase and Fis domain